MLQTALLCWKLAAASPFESSIDVSLLVFVFIYSNSSNQVKCSVSPYGLLFDVVVIARLRVAWVADVTVTISGVFSHLLHSNAVVTIVGDSSVTKRTPAGLLTKFLLINLKRNTVGSIV